MSEKLARLKKEYTGLFNIIKREAPRFPHMWITQEPDNMENIVKHNQCVYIQRNAGKIARLGVLYREILSIDKNALN